MKKKGLKRIGYTLAVLFVLLNIMASFHAWKFTHFYKDGVKVKPPGEMNFIDKASAIFFGVSYPKSIVTDSLHEPHITVHFTTTDSLHLEAWYLTHQNDSLHPHKGTVLIFHGHATCRSGVICETEEFFRLGFDVLSTDFRAHGNSEGSTCTIGWNEIKDVKAAYDFIHTKGEKQVVLYGVSLGAATILRAMNEYALEPDKVILEMPFAALENAVEGRVKMMGLPAQPISSLLTFWGGTENGFWAFGFKPVNYAHSIKCPVLLQWGMNDPRVTEAETDSIYAHLSSVKKKLVKYSNSGHQSLCKNEYDKWEREVAVFLAE